MPAKRVPDNTLAKGPNYGHESLKQLEERLLFTNAFGKCLHSRTKRTHQQSTIKKTPDGDIYLRDANGGQSKIKKLDSSTPNKGLGCRQAADGNMDDEYEHHETQCRELAARALEARLDLYESYSMLFSRIVPKVTYSMPLTSFDAKQCKQLNTIIDRVMLNKLNLNRNMPKAVIYSPYHMAGLNYPSFQIIQDQKGILNLLKELRWNKTMANDILTVMSAIQLCSGLTDPIMEDTATDLSYLGKSWFLHIRQHLKAFRGKLWIEHLGLHHSSVRATNH